MSNFSKNRNLDKIVVFFLLNILFIPSTVFGQRTVDYDQYPETYFDSIRALIYDTVQENYTISAYQLDQKSEPIIVDGKLEEEVWKKAEHRGGFLEKEPFPLVPISEKTEFAILYDKENLYIGVWCWDTEPEKIVQELSPRGTSAPDHVMLFIDSYHDHRTGYKLVVSPTGVQVDELRYDDIKRDNNWNGVWYSEGSVDTNGWYAEVKVPFYNFRYNNKPLQTWGFNIIRNISKNASRGQWKPHLPEWDNTTRMSQMGNVENIKNISSGRKFEFRPYIAAGTSNSITTNPTKSINIGGDIRYSPTPNLTADLTINPDFAQVDADVFEINLTRFPIRFKELRPFFTERINVFNTPKELFYSRRIGASGSILGGGKITGKLNHGIEFGSLGIRTGRPIFKNGSGNAEEANFAVVRAKKDVFSSGSIGVLAAVKEERNKYNRVLGFDGNFILKQDDIVDFQISSGSYEKSIGQTMAYYFGYTHTGDLWGITANLDRVEPGFEINRIGYIQKEPDRGWNKGTGSFRFSPRINKHTIRRITSNVKYEVSQDLFTTRYIESWLLRYVNFIPDDQFGEIVQTDNQSRSISDGRRQSTNIMVGGDALVKFINEMSLFAEYSYFTATELTGKYNGNFLKLEYSTRPLNLGAKFAGIFSASGGTYYNFEQQLVGSQRTFTIAGQGRLSHSVLSKLQGGFTKTTNQSNEKDGQFFNISSNTNWMFTKDFFLRVHAQGIFGTAYLQEKQVNNDYLLSCLLSWQYRPGSFIYLGYNEGRYDELDPLMINRLAFKNRTIVLKVSYFFSL